MSTPNASGRFKLEPWQVGDLRLTAFPIPAPIEAHTEGKRWETLVGKKPESVSSHNFDLEVEENGPFEAGGKLTYRRSPRAIQWMVQGVPNSDKPETSFFASPQILVPFKDLMCRWLGDCPALQRLAFGAALYLPMKDRREAYRQLAEYLQSVPEYSDDEGDFLYQYNRRRRSVVVPEVKINRLSKWTWVPLGEVHVKDGKLVFPAASACLLELDINTIPEFQGTLPRDRYVPLFEEMIGLAAEIAAQGDVP